MKGTVEQPESAQLLPKSSNGDQPRFSVLRARIAAAFIPVFTLSAASSRETMITQYLVQRMADIAGVTNSTEISACTVNRSSPEAQTANDLQAQTSEQLTYYILAQTIPAFFTCLLMGSYTDYVGRRLLLLMPVLTNFVKTAIGCFVIKFHLDLRYLYLAYGIDGMAGSWFFMLLTLYSFTADLSATKKDRTFWIYFVSCATAIMTAVINIAVGYLIRIYGYFEATILLCGLTFVSFIVPLIFLPETLQQRRSIKGVSPLTHMRKIFGFYFIDGSIRRRATFCVCLILFVIGVANELNISSLDALYQMHAPFCWDSVQIGYYSAIRSAGGSCVAMIIFKLLQMCVSVERIGMMGSLFQAGAFVFEAFIQVSWQFYLVPVVLIPSCLTISIVRTMFSILAGPDNQGAVFSSIAVVETLCSLVTSQIYNRIYSATVAFMPGAVYLVMATVGCLTFLLFGVYFLVREQPSYLEVVVDEKLADGVNIQRSDSLSSRSSVE